MTSIDPLPLRPLDPIELFSSSRHHIGIYRCVTITARHALPSPIPQDLSHPIFPALASLISSHPMLRVGILNQHTSKATFSHIPTVDLRDQVEFRRISEENYDQAVSDVQGWCDDQRFQNIETKPPWRIIVVTPDNASNKPIEDIVFAFHHSLMDGTSGRRFHELLLAALNSPPPSPPQNYMLSFPDPPTLPEAQDAAIPFRNSPIWMARTLWAELAPSWLRPTKPSIWAGKAISYAQPHHTRVIGVDIPPSVVNSLLQACRKEGSSITALFHGLCLASFGARVSERTPEMGFLASTPISLRPYLKNTVHPSTRDTFRVLISSMDHSFPPASLNAPTGDIDSLIWDHARRIKTELQSRVASLPANDITSLARYITSWADHWASKDGQPRPGTWEVSSIGSVDVPPGTGSRHITRVLFTNGAMIAGPGVGVNIASVKGGVLTAGISWNEGVYEDALVEGLAEDLGLLCRRFYETGRFEV